MNAPGLIDPGYRGEVRIILVNTDLAETFEVSIGDRIAQLMFLPLANVSLASAGALQDTSRGERGFGSSGRGERA